MQISILSHNNDLEILLLQHHVCDVSITTCNKSEAIGGDVIIYDLEDNRDYSDISYSKGRAHIVLSHDKPKGRGFYHLKKPYKIKEFFDLLSGIIAENNNIIPIGNWSFDYHGKNISIANNELNITDTEAEIIKALIDSYPKHLTKKDLLNRVWGYSDITDTHTVETHIYRLRKKIGKVENQADLISTEKDGYKINKTT